MREDFAKLAAVISHSDNKEIHIPSIRKLISFYCQKWNLEEDYEVISLLANTIFVQRGLMKEL